MRMQLATIDWAETDKGKSAILTLVFQALDGPPFPSFARGTDFVMGPAATVTVDVPIKTSKVPTTNPRGTWTRDVDGELRFYLYEYVNTKWSEIGRVNADGTPYTG